jgi:hypothetical protein
MKQRFRFIGISELVLEHEQGSPKSTHVATNVRMEISKNLDRARYLKNDLPTKEGLKPFTMAFIQGLVANIHHGHEKGWWDSAEHLRYIMEELSRGFAEVATVSEGKMNAYGINPENPTL